MKFISYISELVLIDNMDMVVVDLCGLIYGKYILIIILVKLCIVFVEIFNRKLEVVNYVIKWNIYVIVLIGKILKRFYSDGGGEY